MNYIGDAERMKQTARNNEFLEAVKKVMNIKIYKKALTIYNERGQAETVDYLNQYCKWEILEKYYVPADMWYYKEN